ncbi:MAG: hypothetical protein WD767_13585 [Alphaproteobacteria bacterium]
MDFKGSWRPLERGESAFGVIFSNFDLQYDSCATVLENGRYKIVYEGVIWDFSDGEILSDPSILDRAFGYYTYVLFDKGKNEILIGTDRFGFCALYYAQENGSFLFSSSLNLLKNCLKSITPNFDAWDELLTLGDILGTKTVVTQISRARWGQKFLLTFNTVKTIDIWSPETPLFLDKKQYIKENNNLLIESMNVTKNHQKQKIIFLSGGHDSRRIAVAANSIDMSVTYATQVALNNSGMDEDTLIAEEVAHRLGQEIFTNPLPNSERILKDTELKDDLISYESQYHGWVMHLLRNIPEGAMIYDGIVGDVTINGHFFVHNPSAISNYSNTDFLAQLICGGKKSFLDSRLVTSPLFERVRAELALYPNSPHRMTYFFLFNHTRRNIGSWFLLFKKFGHVPCMPYIYYPLLIQSLSLDPKYYLENWMQMECLKHMNSEVAAIPSTRGIVPDGYVRDFRSKKRADMELMIKNIRMRKDAKEVFVTLKRQIMFYDFFTKLGVRKHTHSSIWAPFLVSRFSKYLDWMDS